MQLLSINKNQHIAVYLSQWLTSFLHDCRLFFGILCHMASFRYIYHFEEATSEFSIVSSCSNCYLITIWNRIALLEFPFIVTLSKKQEKADRMWTKKIAPGEDRTHDLKIMRLTRCLLRYRGSCLILTTKKSAPEMRIECFWYTLKSS